MSYNSGNPSDGGYDPRQSGGQRSPSSPAQDKTGVYDTGMYARQSRSARSNTGSRPRASVPRSRSRTAAPQIRLNPVAVLAVVSSALTVILAIVLIVVLTSRNRGGDTPAPTPTQQSILVPTQPAVAYQTPPATATVIVTPPPSAEPTPVPTAAPTQAPTQAPIHTSTPVTDRTYTREGVLADAQAAAERDSHYSTVSEKDVELEIPAESAFLRTPILKKVYAGEEGRAIYIMPKPIPGNGVLGTVAHGQTVTVVAENQYYYFFVTQDGRAGWNGKSYFKDP